VTAKKNLPPLKIYEVGGAVRDALLGLPVQDHDYVVVGSTAEEMVERGFRPVGKDFPVFLHPDTHQEYALARTERKTARGYKGFQIHAAPDVTLEQDLARRDLTINAMAHSESGELIDPYGGAKDLQARILRHVSEAFSEDPVRILRVARFAARFSFAVAPETLQLMRDMTNSGEVDALVSERVWQELARGLMEKTPSRMFEVLRTCGALEKILPEVDRLFGVPQPPQHHPEIDTGVHVMMVIDYAAEQNYSLEVRFAALMHDLGKGMTPPSEWPKHHGHEAKGVDLVKQLCTRIKVPSDSRDLALLAARYHGDIHRAQQLRSDTLLRLFKSADAFRRPERFAELLRACECDARGRLGLHDQAYPQADYLAHMLAAARGVDAGAIAQACVEPAQIEAKVDEARLHAITLVMQDYKLRG
jgi:tRNA nucleotidyltransferase (CCA-adding enzyme)